MTIFGTAGKDHLGGTNAGDDFDVGQGGDDTVAFFGTYTLTDKIDGGSGEDVIASIKAGYQAGRMSSCIWSAASR